MVEVWITLALLNTDLLVLASRRVGWAWPWPWLNHAAPTARCAAERQRQPDLNVLDLERMPSSKHELRKAYRAAAKSAHRDGGSADAFQAVSEAFERLARGLDPEAA